METLEAQVAQLSRHLRTLRKFSSLLADGIDADDVMVALAEHVALASTTLYAGVLSAGPEGVSCVAFTNESVAAIEQAMVDAQEGPAIDAVVQHRTVTAADASNTGFAGRWPDFAQAARNSGIRAVAALPLGGNNHVIGAVDIYRRTPTAWSENDLSTAHTLASMASSYVSQSEQVAQHRRTSEQLQFALTSRIDIEQAKGILAVVLNTYTEDAFLTLRNVARMNNARLHDVCAHVLSRYRREPGPLPPVDAAVTATIDRVLTHKPIIPTQRLPWHDEELG